MRSSKYELTAEIPNIVYTTISYKLAKPVGKTQSYPDVNESATQANMERETLLL